MRALYTSTVRGLISKRPAISRCESPSTSRSRTSRSRGVNRSKRERAACSLRLASYRRLSSRIALVRMSSKISSLTGFSRKSNAPFFMARRVVRTSPCAVKTTTGSKIPRWCNACCRSSPLIPCICRSVSTQPRHSAPGVRDYHTQLLIICRDRQVHASASGRHVGERVEGIGQQIVQDHLQLDSVGGALARDPDVLREFYT